MGFFDLFRSKGNSDRFSKAQCQKESDELDMLMQNLRGELTSSVPNMVTVKHVDPSENVPTPRNAAICYLDAKALQFWEGRHTDFKVPDYYSNSAFGRNVSPALKRLLDGGYLDVGDIRTGIAIKQVPELKAILSEHKLKVSGRKSELIQRLIDNIPLDKLEALFPVRSYEITDKGRSALEEYSLFFQNENSCLDFPYHRLMQEREKKPNASNDDIFISLLAENISKALKGNNHESYRIAVEKMARFMDHIGRTSDSMQYYCLSFFMFWYRNTTILKVRESVDVYGYMSRGIDRCGQMCGYNLEQTLREFQQALKKHNPFGLCTNRNINLAISVFKSAISVQ